MFIFLICYINELIIVMLVRIGRFRDYDIETLLPIYPDFSEIGN